MRIFEHGTFRFLAVNDAAVKLYGYTREEFLAMTAKDTRHPEELDEFLTTLDEPTVYFRHRGPRRHVRKNGEVIVVEAVTQDILYKGRKARLSMNIDVTERNKGEEEVRRQKNLLAAVIDNLPVGVFIRDAKTLRYVMRNRFSEKMFGYPVETSAGKTAYDVFPKEQADLTVASDRQALENGQMVDIPELKMLGRAGDTRIQHVRKVPVFDPDGKPWLLVGISHDITERKVAERALHESESKYRNLVESSSDLIWSTDAEGRITFINEAVRRIYGYEPEEMLGRPLIELLGDGHTKKSFAFFRKMLAEDRSATDYECEAQHKNGERVVLSSNAIVLRDAEGKRIGVTGISKDVTARKRAEQALREKSEFLQKMIESSRDCIKVLDLEGRLLSISAGGQRLMEIDEPSSLLGKSYLDFWDGAERDVASKALDTARAGEANQFEGYSPTTRGVPKWWNEIVTPILGDDGSPEKLLVVSRDITEHKRAEEGRMEHALRQRDALVREVHHRIKNSLQGVAGLLRQKIGKHPAIAPGIEEAVAQLQSVALVYGLQETRPDGLLDLAEITNAICNSAESLIGGRVERIFERGSGRPACVAGSEAVSVAVALNELVFNALKHQPAEAGEKRARVTLCETGDAAEIRITNRGRLPAGFDYAGGGAAGNGLGLVRTLLASPGGAVAFNGGPDEVEVILKLTPPLLADRQETIAR